VERSAIPALRGSAWTSSSAGGRRWPPPLWSTECTSRRLQKKPREPGKGSRGQGADLGEGYPLRDHSRGERDLRQTLHPSRAIGPTDAAIVRESFKLRMCSVQEKILPVRRHPHGRLSVFS